MGQQIADMWVATLPARSLLTSPLFAHLKVRSRRPRIAADPDERMLDTLDRSDVEVLVMLQIPARCDGPPGHRARLDAPRDALKPTAGAIDQDP